MEDAVDKAITSGTLAECTLLTEKEKDHTSKVLKTQEDSLLYIVQVQVVKTRGIQ